MKMNKSEMKYLHIYMVMHTKKGSNENDQMNVLAKEM